MKRGIFRTGIAALIMSTMMVGCGSKSADSMDAYGSYQAKEDIYVNSTTESSYDYAEEYELDDAGMESASGTATELLDEKSSNRKLIRNVAMDVETEQFEELLVQIEKKTSDFGGYIENSYSYNGNSTNSSKKKNASLTIRIPAENLDAFLETVSDKSNVTSKNENVTDVTLQYVDLESHKKALKAEQERLLEMMDEAETIEDMISIESRLSEVRYQLESQEAQLRTFDNQINYSTVNLNIKEVTKYTPVKERSFWEIIGDGFVENVKALGDGFVDVVIWFITSLPFLIVWAIVIFVGIKILGRFADINECRKRGISRRELKAERAAKKVKINETAKAAVKDMAKAAVNDMAKAAVNDTPEENAENK